MKKSLSLIISAILGIIVFILIYIHIDLKQVLSSFRHITLLTLLSYIAAVSLIEIFLVIRWDQILKAQKILIPFKNLFMYKEIGYAVGYLSPQSHIGGEPVRAFLLKRHGLDFKQGLSTVLIDKSMQLITDAWFVSMGFVVLFTKLPFPTAIKVIALLLGSVPFFLLMLFYYCMFRHISFFSRAFNLLKLHKVPLLRKIKGEITEIEGYILHFFKYHRNKFIRIISLNLILWVLMFWEYKTALLMFGHNASISQIFLVLSAVGLAYLMPVPVALGVLEVSQVSTLKLLNIDQAIGISLSLLIRTKDLIRTGIGLLFLSYFGLPWNWKKKQKNT